MKKLKVIALSVLAFVTIASMVFVGCQKSVEVIPEKNTEVKTNSITLSKEIFDLDKKISTNKSTRVTTKKIVGYAVADGSAAIGTFKGTVGIVGPGYAAAFGFLGGICGSLYHGWQQGDYLTIKPYIPPTTSLPNFITDLNNPLSVGVAHNKLLSELVNNPKISFSNYSNLMSTSYNYLVKRTATEFNLNENIIRENFTLDQYKSVGVENRVSLPLNISKEVSNGGNINILNYTNEYLIRFQNPSATLEDLILYSDIFIENINQQSNLSQQEKYNIKAIISVFKNSLLYWQNV